MLHTHLFLLHHHLLISFVFEFYSELQETCAKHAA